MLFDGLANRLTKHYKLIIIAWIIVLVIAVPAIMQAGNVIQSGQTGSSGDPGSAQAQKIITIDFQRSVANGTLMIVLQSGNMTDASSRNFVLALQQKIQGSSDIKDLQNVSTAYTYAEQMIDGTVMQIGLTMRPTEENVTISAFLLWGVPAMYAANYTHSGSDTLAFNSTYTQLVTFVQEHDLDQNSTAFAIGYFQAFANAWNGTSDTIDPMVRAADCVQSVAPEMINALPNGEVQTRQMLQQVLSRCDLTNYNNVSIVRSLTLDLIGGSDGISNMTFLQQVYDLGPSYKAAAVSTFASSIVDNGTLATYPIAMSQQLISNFVSSDNETMLMIVSFTVGSDYSTANGDHPLIDNVGALRNIISDLRSGTSAPITTYVTGSAALSADSSASSAKDMATIRPLIIITLIVLVGLLFRSVLGPFLPFGVVVVALGLSQAVVFFVGTLVAPIDPSIPTMLFTILMAVGTDYSVFIIMRYREERVKGATKERAVHTSITWAGESIVTSGVTVIIAFFAMATASISTVSTMGLVFGMSVVIALLLALTLIPSLLMLVGNRVFWPTTGKRWKRLAEGIKKKKERRNGYFRRAASFAIKHAKVILVIAILISIPTTYLFMTTETSYDSIATMGSPESVQGLNAMSSGFGAGGIMPTQVVITGDTTIFNGSNVNMAYLNAIGNISATIAADPMVQQVSGITRPYGQPVDYENLSVISAQERSQLISSMLQSVGSDGKSVLLTVVLKGDPESASSVNLVPSLRTEIAKAKAEEPALASSTILVGGTTASIYDQSQILDQQFGYIELLVMIGIFVVLMIVLGSMLLPLFAVVSIAMSISWSFALTTLVFGNVLGRPILYIVPLILFIMLMGIGMDYNVFILTRIREEVHKGKSTNEAVVDAADWTGGIISALALIMACAFGALLLSSNVELQEIGFCLAVAILLDAMFIRTYVVPAAMALMGKHAWWAPGRLQREGRGEKMSRKTPAIKIEKEDMRR